MPLTGRFNFRRTLTGRIVLQVEEDKPVWWSRNGKTRRSYRDANVMDLAKPEMRALIDLRNKPQYGQPLSRAPEQMPQIVADRTDEIGMGRTRQVDGGSEGPISTHGALATFTSSAPKRVLSNLERAFRAARSLATHSASRANPPSEALGAERVRTPPPIIPGGERWHRVMHRRSAFRK